MPLEEEGRLGERVRFRRTFKTYRIYEEPPVPIISSFPRTLPPHERSTSRWVVSNRVPERRRLPSYLERCKEGLPWPCIHEY
jgi:hypothetical protein